ncbi:MAG: alpha-L-rhamnosidase [Paenibacillaceae bacterium]|jgi:hypothetical protein|nr:alpha-L-rhamnosidase [Paenibacillaceae bacterium]
MNQEAVWKGQWIWSAEGEASPRNEWRCFRKSFQVAEEQAGSHASLRLTADSRYVLYVNGDLVGRGPVRSWPFKLAYDQYEVGHLLRPGKENTIAVLVMHYGIPTFQYLRGRGGLLAQLETENSSGEYEVLAATDSTWRTQLHAGYDTRSSRISCQLPFVEVLDAREEEAGWNATGFDDAAWPAALVIGPAGMEPWTTLVERDIPPLTEESVFPVRVESLKRVKPRSYGVVLDMRNHFVPESEYHANNVEFCGYFATVIRTEAAVRATIGIVDGGRLSGPCSLNGVWRDEAEVYGTHPERYWDVSLNKGDNLLLMDLHGNLHGHGFHWGIDCSEPVELVSPLAACRAEQDVYSPFATLGTFDAREIIDHQPERTLRRDHPDYLSARGIANADDFTSYTEWAKPVLNRLVSTDDLFSRCVWVSSSAPLAVPYALQHAVIANREPALVPVYPGEDTELVIDFGKEYSGYITFAVEAAAGTVLDFYGFEYTRNGWRQETYGLDNTMRYVCKEGYQTYTSHVRRGLRYLMIVVRGSSIPVKLQHVHFLQSNYPVAEIGRFKCSDPLLNDIWEISQHTTRLCMEDTFVDCPAFEQAFWVGDARNEALVNYYLFGDTAIVKRCLEMVPDSSFQSPLYGDQVPSGWSSVIPNWTFFWSTACLELYRYSGDLDFAGRIWPAVRFTLDHYLQKLDNNGLLNMKGWNLLDWAPIDQPNNGTVTHQNMFLVQALRSAAALAEASGDEGAQQYLAHAGRLQAAINAGLWSEEHQAYVDCIHADGRVSTIFSMQTQVVAYLCDIAPDNRRSRLEEYLAAPPADFVAIGSPFMSFFHYEALMKLGRSDLMLGDMRVRYGQMVNQQATTCWEMYPKPLEKRSHPEEMTRSHCHAWSAGPAYFLGTAVLGVRGLDAGWTKVLVEPQVVDLSWATGTVPLPGHGRIDVAWQADKETGHIHIRVEAPAHVEVSVVPPAGYEASLEQITLG